MEVHGYVKRETKKKKFRWKIKKDADEEKIENLHYINGERQDKFGELVKLLLSIGVRTKYVKNVKHNKGTNYFQKKIHKNLS